MNYYFHLRWLLLRRMAKELGAFISTLLTFVTFILIYAFTYVQWYWQGVGFALLLLYIHKKRKDIGFLEIAMGHKHTWYAIVFDYTMVLLPFCAFSLFRGNIVEVFVFIGISVLIPFTKRYTWQVNIPPKTILQNGGLEYEKGFRETFPLFFPSIVLVFIGVCYENINLAKIAAIAYFIIFVSAFPNIVVRRDYMSCYSSTMRLHSMTTVNTVIYTAILAIPFLALFVLKWHLQGLCFCGAMCVVACLGSLEMSLLRYHINGNTIINVVSIGALFFLGVSSVMMPITLLFYVVIIILTFLSVSNRIKKEIYGFY